MKHRKIIFNVNPIRDQFNRVKPLAEQRDELLESSDYYRRNMHSLTHNPTASTEMRARIIPSIQLAALREAGVSLREAQAMLAA